MSRQEKNKWKEEAAKLNEIDLQKFEFGVNSIMPQQSILEASEKANLTKTVTEHSFDDSPSEDTNEQIEELKSNVKEECDTNELQTFP